MKELLVYTPLILLIGAFITLLTIILNKINNFIDISEIAKSHFNIFNRNKLNTIQFHLVPLFIALSIVQIKLLDKDIINNLNVVMSILISMFFAMLSIISTLPVNKKPIYCKLLSETMNTLLFECILCVIVLISTLTILFIDKYPGGVIFTTISFLVYFLVILIILNIFIIMKRLQVLLLQR